MPDNLRQDIRSVGEQLATANNIACMTGAGISAESGVATFRDAHGLWEGHRPEDVACPEAFARDPEMVWRFYLARRQRLLQVVPNDAHHALVELEQHATNFDLVTQNVDGLHQAAGSHNINALHGDIWIDRCTRCGREERVADVSVDMPRCDLCGAIARPGVVWFGEMLPDGAIDRAAASFASAQVVLVIGTSSVVQPAASLASWAKDAGALVVEINLERTPLSGVADISIQGKAGELMPQIMAAYRAAT